MPIVKEKESSYKRFLTYLKKSYKFNSKPIHALTVAGEKNPIYRERVYYYELYHQLRKAVDEDFDYSLGGEIDKARHPILSNFALDKIKPDLLVHKPGDMERNLVVIEVKPMTANATQIKKDLFNLNSFVGKAQYFRSIYLIYSGDDKKFNRFRKRAIQQVEKFKIQIDVQTICLYWHQSVGEEAMGKNWEIN